MIDHIGRFDYLPLVNSFPGRYRAIFLCAKAANCFQPQFCLPVTKFSALNVDFDGLSHDFLGSRKPAGKGIKKRYTLIKVVI